MPRLLGLPAGVTEVIDLPISPSGIAADGEAIRAEDNASTMAWVANTGSGELHRIDPAAVGIYS